MKKENKWLCFPENRFIRKSAIVSYHMVGLTIEIFTPYYSFKHTLDSEAQVCKWLDYLHDELRDN
jgi:hypothetical protein